MQELVAVRVKDGIFVGNVTAAQDREFIAMNKITHIINCAGGELPDLFVDDDVKYLTFPWRDTTGGVCTAVMFDSADENIKRTVEFINEALEVGDCVLVHSHYGLSRSPALLAAYLIVKYGWRLDSAISYLEMAHKDMSIKPHFLRQLRMFAKRNYVEHDVFDMDIDDSSFGLDNDQWLLRNTLLNGLTYEFQRQNELYKLCTMRVDVGQPVKQVDSRTTSRVKKGKHIVFIDTKQGTHVNSNLGTPIVTAETLSYPDSEKRFLGYQGSVALRGRRRRKNIMSRSITPCGRFVESDPRTNPRGRQELRVRSDPNGGRSASIADGATSSQAVRTASGHSTLDGGGSLAGAEYRHVASPNTVSAHGRSPFAALTSSHRYRKGSPLPASTHDSAPSRVAQRPLSASTTDINATRKGLSLRLGASRPSRNSLMSTSTPNTVGNMGPVFPSSSRLSSYRNIAPHRPRTGTGLLSSCGSSKTGLSSSAVHFSNVRSSSKGSRPSSPVGRPSSATERTSSPRGSLYESCLSRSLGVGNNSSKGGTSGVLCRQTPAAISSGRRL